MIDGTRTRDPRDHNPVLYQLSYDHHARLGANPSVPDNHSHTPVAPVERVTYSSAATALAASTSGPGCGTKMVRR